MSDDIRAIEAVIERQFASLTWTGGAGGDWAAFAGDFFPGAPLHPAARPARRQSVDAFVERMTGLAGSTLTDFSERVLGTEIRVFGSVAVALAACEIVENRETVSRGVEAMLLIKDGGAWKIVAQAWDTEGGDNPIPDRLLSGD